MLSETDTLGDNEILRLILELGLMLEDGDKLTLTLGERDGLNETERLGENDTLILGLSEVLLDGKDPKENTP